MRAAAANALTVNGEPDSVASSTPGAIGDELCSGERTRCGGDIRYGFAATAAELAGVRRECDEWSSPPLRVLLALEEAERLLLV